MNMPKMNPMEYTLAAVLMMLGLHFLVPIARVVPPPWTLLGLVPLVAGVTISAVAEQAFHQAGTTVQPFQTSSALVTRGLYHITRNPMYLGLVLALAGVAIILGSLMPWIMVALFVVIIDRQFVVKEEKMLAQRFGDEWRSYAARTRRWI